MLIFTNISAFPGRNALIFHTELAFPPYVRVGKPFRIFGGKATRRIEEAISIRFDHRLNGFTAIFPSFLRLSPFHL
jgi:hypothetical protein